MAFWRKLFGGDAHVNGKPAPPSAAAAATAPGGARGIRFDSTLVNGLKRDHRELVDLYGRIGRLIESGHFGDIPGELLVFKTRLEAHLLTENVRFYTYLEQSLEGDADNVAIIHDFRREMNTIARAVIEFVKRYQTARFDEPQRKQFTDEYAKVGGLLAQRIEREESNLYPLYQAM